MASALVNKYRDSVTLKASYSYPFRGRQRTMVWKDDRFTFDESFGIKDAFPKEEDPGWLSTGIHVTFRSRGDYRTDSICFHDSLWNAHRIVVTYHGMK